MFGIFMVFYFGKLTKIFPSPEILKICKTLLTEKSLLLIEVLQNSQALMNFPSKKTHTFLYSIFFHIHLGFMRLASLYTF